MFRRKAQVAEICSRYNALPEECLFSCLGSLRIQVQVLWGTDDAHVPVAPCRALRDLIPDVSLIVVDNACR